MNGFLVIGLMKYSFAFDDNQNIVKSITSKVYYYYRIILHKYSITIPKNPKYLKIDAEILSKAVDN